MMGETTELHTHGDALPVRDGEVVRDAPAGTRAVEATESTVHVLAQQEGSPESKLSARVDETTSADWPKRHADLDELAAAHDVSFDPHATVAEKISALERAGVQPS